jgi:hypothetical protein
MQISVEAPVQKGLAFTADLLKIDGCCAAVP